MLAILAAIYFYFVLFPRLFPVSKSTTEPTAKAVSESLSHGGGLS